MDERDFKKGHLLISFLFPENTELIDDLKNEDDMKRDLNVLVEEWFKKGYIRRCVVAPDEVISEKLKNDETEKTDA